MRALVLDSPSPVGVAAGLDKEGTWFEGLGALGFGFVDVGTVTAPPTWERPASDLSPQRGARRSKPR